jgi:hypothetical protein
VTSGADPSTSGFGRRTAAARPGHSAAVAQPPEHRNRDAEAENTSRLAAIEARIATIDKNFAADFPDCATLVAPTPLSVESVRTQLAAGEAMVLFLDTAELKPTLEWRAWRSSSEI